MGFDQNSVVNTPGDPHNGKTVYTISWDMSITNLTLEDNVVAFIQDDDVNHTDGMIRILNNLSIGTGSYIEAIDDRPRLEISNPTANVSGMTLYDHYGETNQATMTTNNGNMDGRYFMINGAPTPVWTKYNITIPVDAKGNMSVTTSAKKFIYAYARLDYDFNNIVDDDDIRFALAAELVYKLRGAPGSFGLSRVDYAALAPENIWNSLSTDAAILRDRITLIAYDKKTVINAEEVEEARDRYKATIDWGYTDEGDLISGSVYVYILDRPEELLICTDFDESIGDGGTFYVRKGFEDKRVLIGDANYYNNPNYLNRWQEVHEDYFSTVITTDSFSNVVAGGNGVTMYVKNKDRNLFTFQTISYYQMNFQEQGTPHTLDSALFVKIFKRGGLLFATKSEGEAKRYDFVSHDATGNAADKFWEAGGQYPVKLFIHDNILHIMPLNDNTGVAKALKKVTLTDSIPAAAVTINNDDTSDIVITFNSNFYDTVSFELEYADGSKGAFKVEREGIIIQYGGLNDTGNGRY
ncbi:MAG: hypothetical protein IK001_05280, partial [Lachnospiraceae bacterium]|nr:hypothetical protein [Lachnospiraceae bacterium]